MIAANSLHKKRRRTAVTLIWVALSGLLFIGFVGLAMDTSYVYYTAEQLQAVADGSALAGALYVKIDQSTARTKAVDLAALNKAGGQFITLDRNDANADGGDIVLGRFDRQDQSFTPTIDGPNAVKVVAKRANGSALSLLFGGVFGVNSADVQKDAIAMTGGGTGAGLIALSTDPSCSCSLEMKGNVTVNVLPTAPLTCDDGAGVQVNCGGSNAMCMNGNTQMHATEVNIHGDFGGPAPEDCAHINGGTCGGDCGTSIVNEGAGVISDPLASVPEPSISGLADLGAVVLNNGTLRIPPLSATGSIFYYSRGIRATGGNLIMRPGVYILGGNTDNSGNPKPTGFNISGNTSICARGVMLYIKGPFGEVDVTGGSGTITIDPLDFSKPSSYWSFCDGTFVKPVGLNTLWEGITFFQSRTNTNQARITGNSALHMTGTLYFPQNNISLGGTGYSVGNQLIAWTVEAHGNGTIDINYDGRNPSSAGQKVFLVE